MFSLTVIDHVRLDSEHVAQNYTVHARAAERLVGLVSSWRIGIAALLALSSCTAAADLLFPGRALQIAAVAAGSFWSKSFKFSVPRSPQPTISTELSKAAVVQWMFMMSPSACRSSRMGPTLSRPAAMYRNCLCSTNHYQFD